MTTATRRRRHLSLTLIGLSLFIAATGAACAAPSATATPVAPPTQVQSAGPISSPEPNPSPSANAPNTEPPPTAEPAELAATPTQPAATVTTAPTPPQTARYELTFDATWSADTHPTDFPSNPHFSPLIGAAHGPGAALWQAGALASPGIKNMAETGGTNPLDSEISALIAEGTTCVMIAGGGVPVSPGRVQVAFEVSLECPLVSIVTMIAPSPDWFVGVSGVSLLQDGAWVDELQVELLPYDAGTDSGPTYGSPNDATTGPEPIYLLNVEPLLIGGRLPALGTFTFTRLDG